jgi:carotenoid cleavage dioxygenase-like enzyme
MRDLKNFISPSLYKTPPMRVQVIDKNGEMVKAFDAPPGFQLERYVDSVYPGKEFMMTASDAEVTISVLDDDEITEIYRGVYK